MFMFLPIFHVHDFSMTISFSRSSTNRCGNPAYLRTEIRGLMVYINCMRR